MAPLSLKVVQSMCQACAKTGKTDNLADLCHFFGNFLCRFFFFI